MLNGIRGGVAELPWAEEEREIEPGPYSEYTHVVEKKN